MKPLGTWDPSTRSPVTWKPFLLLTCLPELPCLSGRYPAPSPVLTHPGRWNINFKNTVGWEERTKAGRHCPGDTAAQPNWEGEPHPGHVVPARLPVTRAHAVPKQLWELGCQAEALRVHLNGAERLCPPAELLAPPWDGTYLPCRPLPGTLLDTAPGSCETQCPSRDAKS